MVVGPHLLVVGVEEVDEDLATAEIELFRNLSAGLGTTDNEDRALREGCRVPILAATTRGGLLAHFGSNAKAPKVRRQKILSVSFASSDMQSLSHGGSKVRTTFT